MSSRIEPTLGELELKRDPIQLANAYQAQKKLKRLATLRDGLFTAAASRSHCRLAGVVSRFDDAAGHRQTSRTPGGDAEPVNAVNPSRCAGLLGFTTFTSSLLPRRFALM